MSVDILIRIAYNKSEVILMSAKFKDRTGEHFITNKG